MSAIAFSRAIGPVPIACVIREKPISELEITEIPVEFGAAITDHAYPLPKKVTLEIADIKGEVLDTDAVTEITSFSVRFDRQRRALEAFGISVNTEYDQEVRI